MQTYLPSEGYSLTDLFTVFFAVLGGTFALWQYYKTNKMARARAAADEVEHFYSDESVKTALRVIDWHSGSISVVDESGSRQKKTYAPLDFHLALRPHTTNRSSVRTYEASDDHYRSERERNGKRFEDIFSPTEQYLREVFDSFLGRLERIEMLIECGVIGEKNFGDVFSYWLHVIGDEKDASTSLAHFSNPKREALLEYVKFYQFAGVQRLFARYGRTI
ncbi:hypothetical protein [Rhizobium leguminosarum]